jgi:glyoxylase-like metal-dependent hydrolase (beta-lactamase superfamily II)
VTDVIITHLHFDHCGVAQYLTAIKKRFLPILTPLSSEPPQWKNYRNLHFSKKAPFSRQY